MKHLRKFLQLPPVKQTLLVEAASLLVLVRLGLAVLPFHTLRRLLARIAALPAVSSQGVSVGIEETVAWAVEVASHYGPGSSSCLVQALAAQALLQRRGHPANLRIGVAREVGNPLRAHAWVESKGKIIIGGENELQRYTPLPVWEDYRVRIKA